MWPLQMLQLIACLEYTMLLLLSCESGWYEHGVDDGETVSVNPPLIQVER